MIKIPSKTVLLYKIRTAIVFSPFIAVFGYFSFISSVFGIIAVGLFALAVVTICIIIPAHFNSYEIDRDDTVITVKRGFFIRSEYTVPIKNITERATFTFPISSINKLYGVILRSAGTVLLIPELESSDAERLIE